MFRTKGIHHIRYHSLKLLGEALWHKLNEVWRKAEEGILESQKSSLGHQQGRGFDRELLLRRALVTSRCGAGGVLTEPLAERVLNLLCQLSTMLRNRYRLVQRYS